jgi:hypothetical protein
MKYFLLLLTICSLNLSAQEIDSLRITKPEHNLSNPKKYQSYIIPSLFIGYGLITLDENAARNLDFSTKAELNEDHPRFAAHVDDYIEFAPIVAMYALDIAGIKPKNSVIDQTGMVLLNTAISTAVVTVLKKQTHRIRPDGSSYNSFPSGHTTTAFAAAEMLNQEFKGTSPWIGYAGYTVATATGVLRMYNDKHWFSDVVMGAGIGIVSTKLTYIIYPYIKQLFGAKQKKLSFAYTYLNGQLGYSFRYKL